MLKQAINNNSFCYLKKNEIQFNLENEWLIANSNGSYSSGTVSGVLTRKYHGIFVLAKSPPLLRYLCVTKIEEIFEYNQTEYLLYTNSWKNLSEYEPKGYLHLESFYLDENMPVWIFNCGGLLLEKRILLHYNKDILSIKYKILNKEFVSGKLKCNLFVNNRNFHHLNQSEKFDINTEIQENTLYINDKKYNNNIKILSNSDKSEAKNITYYDFYLKEEEDRGFDSIENNLLAGTFYFEINNEKSADILILTQNQPENITPYNHNIDEEIKLYNNIILNFWKNEISQTPLWIQQLVYNSTFFIIRKMNITNEYYYSIIAGYHWFGDWGRDTFISLPGLCLVTGRVKIAHSILKNYASFMKQGLLPNRFPDDNEQPDYNTVDASLWYFNAIFLYYKHTGDRQFIAEMYSTLSEIVAWHIKGTKFNIKLDETDGLIFAGEEGTQLTWMDAKIGTYVVTPRQGKPIEINALWFNALNIMHYFSNLLQNNEADRYSKLLAATAQGFQKFWQEDLQYCYDVLGEDKQHDDSLRPNQILAISLEFSPLSSLQKRIIVDTCGRYLLAFFGLRTLPKFSSNYKHNYSGSPYDRDCAYHQGTAWGWLLGHYAVAFYKVTKNKSVALGFLEPLETQLKQAGIGFISEIFDADYPHKARGCIAQAWSMGETLYAWHYINKN